MARVRVEFRLTGSVSNDLARELAAAAEAFQRQCEAAGFEVRGAGVDVELDDEPALPEQPPLDLEASADGEASNETPADGEGSK